MDLSSNLRVQNKQANCYEDARRLVEQHDELKSIQIFEEAVIKGLVAAYEKNSNAICSFELLMGNEGSFKYKATPEFIEGSMFLNVQR
jgi:TPR repeat protein